MSVYKSARNQSKAQFIANSRTLVVETYRIVVKFPKRYRVYLTDDIVTASKNVYINCTKAQAIFISKYISNEDFQLRHRYLMLAYTNLQSLLCQIDLCYEVVSKGNNFLEKKEYYDKQFEKWVNLGNELEKILKSLMTSDNKRYKEIFAKRETSKQDKETSNEESNEKIETA